MCVYVCVCLCLCVCRATLRLSGIDTIACIIFGMHMCSCDTPL